MTPVTQYVLYRVGSSTVCTVYIVYLVCMVCTVCTVYISWIHFQGLLIGLHCLYCLPLCMTTSTLILQLLFPTLLSHTSLGAMVGF